jgi:hypothetical protein
LGWVFDFSNDENMAEYQKIVSFNDRNANMAENASPASVVAEVILKLQQMGKIN